MRVLVTGHHGYIGVLLVKVLQDAGHDVVGMDTDLYVKSLFRGTVPDCPSILKDIRDVELADLKGFDAVAHLAMTAEYKVGTPLRVQLDQNRISSPQASFNIPLEVEAG